jgi:S1-C subfamily serine protease
MRTSLTVVAVLGAIATAAVAQSRDFGKAYSFAEREPKSRVERTVDGLLPSIVKVHGASGLATIQPYATGVIVSERGHVLTLDQVMIQKDRTRVVLHDGSVHDAQLLPEDPQLGVRLLKIDPELVQGKLQPIWPASRETVDKSARAGRFVVSLGNAFRLAEFSEKVSATFGVVVGKASTALRHRMSDVAFDGELILTDACNNPGHYGGGLFTLDGAWIGLNMRLLDSKETNTMISAAIPASDLLPYLDEFVHGKPRAAAVVTNEPVYTGIVLFDQAGQRSPPAYVERVKKDSPAAKVGLLPDDLIVRIDDFSIRTCREYREVLARFRPGQTITLTYKRGTKVLQGKLELLPEPVK